MDRHRPKCHQHRIVAETALPAALWLDRATKINHARMRGQVLVRFCAYQHDGAAGGVIGDVGDLEQAVGRKRVHAVPQERVPLRLRQR